MEYLAVRCRKPWKNSTKVQIAWVSTSFMQLFPVLNVAVWLQYLQSPEGGAGEPLLSEWSWSHGSAAPRPGGRLRENPPAVRGDFNVLNLKLDQILLFVRRTGSRRSAAGTFLLLLPSGNKQRLHVSGGSGFNWISSSLQE